MKYYNAMPKEQFLDYCITHSETQRALFSKAQIAQVLDLAGYSDKAEEMIKYGEAWMSIDLSDLASEAMNKTTLKIFGKEINLKTHE